MTPSAEDVRRHEAGHAAMARVLGIPVHAVDVVPDADSLGRVTHGLCRTINTRADALHRMLIVLAPLCEAAECVADLPAWPPPRYGTADERNLALLADALGLTEADYRQLVHATADLVLSREFQQLALRIEALLAHRPRLDARMIDALERMEI